MAYSTYDEKRDGTSLDDILKRKKETFNVSLAGPLAFWIGIIVVAALIQLVLIPYSLITGRTQFNVYLNTFANDVLYTPGVFVVPLIAALWIGARVSFLDHSKSLLLSKGFNSAIYCCIIYTVVIAIIFITMKFLNVGVLSSFSTVQFIEYMIGAPFVIVILLAPIFAVLSQSKNYVAPPPKEEEATDFT